MGFLASRRVAGSRLHGWALILTVVIAALTMAIVAPALAAPNVAKAWGRNTEGRLGDGTTTGPEQCGLNQFACSTSPVAVSNLSGVSAVAGGGGHSLALLETGTVMAWGADGSGQLGNGKGGLGEQSDVPVAVSGLSEVTAIAAGENHSLAVLKNGTVMAWGENGAGQLGNGTHTSSDVPVAVSGLSEVIAIAAGAVHSLALLKNGTVMAWGSNFDGQLGNGSTEASDVPVAVSGLSEVTAIAAGENHSLALLNNGTVRAWGFNHEGSLGDKGEANSDVPIEVSNLSGVSRVAAGGNLSLALLGNGTVKSWGENFEGQLGAGTSTGPEHCQELQFPCAKAPIGVVGLSGVAAISAGRWGGLSLMGSGSLASWGFNEYGQLGDGTSTGPEACNGFPCSTKPVEVKTAGATITGISAGREHGLAFGSSPPPAGLPEVGRCVKVATGSGKYSGANCLTLAKPGRGKYEWIPVSVTEKPAFSGSGTEPTLTTVGHATIKCIDANFTGEWTGPKTTSVTLEMQGCTNPSGALCQTTTNPNNQSEIKLNVLGELGYIKYEEVEGKTIIAVGLDLKPQPPVRELAAYECTGSGETGHIEGSVIGKITPINKMTTEQKMLYLASKTGEQRPEHFQGAPPDTLTTSFTAGIPEESKGSGASALNIKSETGKNAEPLEIKAK